MNALAGHTITAELWHVEGGNAQCVCIVNEREQGDSSYALWEPNRVWLTLDRGAVVAADGPWGRALGPPVVVPPWPKTEGYTAHLLLLDERDYSCAVPIIWGRHAVVWGVPAALASWVIVHGTVRLSVRKADTLSPRRLPAFSGQQQEIWEQGVLAARSRQEQVDQGRTVLITERRDSGLA